MQNFFGFIDFREENFSTFKDVKNNNKTIHYEENGNSAVFLSYNKNDESSSINNTKNLLLFNGHISNKSDLQYKLNIQNNQVTISELLEKAYAKWDIKLVEHLEGKFSLIVYDKEKELLFLAKDKIGLLPLNLYYSDNLIIFGSKVSDFKQVPNFSPTINPENLAQYLQFGCLLQPNTIFKSCYKVRSGHYVSIDLKQKKQSSTAYWTLESSYKEKKILLSESEIMKDAQQLLESAIEKDFRNSNKTALLLSGGYDSATIAALLQKQSDSKIDTCTIGFKEKSINEAPYAKEIATHIGTNHCEHYFTDEDALEIIPKLSKIYDEPFANYAATPTVLSSQLLEQQGVKDLFVGDGGDEVFATADDVQAFERILSIPMVVKNIFTTPLKTLPMGKIPYLKDVNNLPIKYEKLMQILSAKSIANMVEIRNKLFIESELKLTVRDYTTPLSSTFNEISFNGYEEGVDEIIGAYFKTTMTDGELVKSYSASNHANISLKTPFLDEKLVCYMSSVPSSIKIKDNSKKYLLKEIAYQHIPKQMLDRPKSGFDIPFSSWMRYKLKDLVYEQINETRLDQDKLFYTSSIITIRDKFYEGNDAYKYKLWRIFLFQLWYENFKG